MKVAIAGFGIEGKSSLDYFLAQGNEVVVLDENLETKLPDGIQSVLGEDAFKDLSSFDLIIRSSGLNPSRLIEHNHGIESKVSTQLNEFLKACPSKDIIGITGTKGKGTTSTLIALMLQASGKQVEIGGNIGVAMLNLLSSITPDTYVILELSSFQLSDLNQPSPHTAVCLMLAPEHLDWHGDLDSYVFAKANLFAHQSEADIAIFYAENDLSRQIAEQSPGKKIPYYAEPGAIIKGNHIIIDGRVICSTKELKLLGQHNWQNVCAAVTAVWQHTQDITAMRGILTSFNGLAHRLEFVREVDNVRYYNDSYASQLKATEAAIFAIPGPKVLVIGGYDRMLDLDEFGSLVAQNQSELRQLVLIGASGERLAEALREKGVDNFILANDLKTMPEVVDKASSLAQPGDAVVLSPGFASFDMFKNFEERGNQFKQAVGSL